jgi:hypothetical protein
MHLSSILREHLTPKDLLSFVPHTAGGAAEQRFAEYDNAEGGCRGIVYLPNTPLTGAGYKLFYLSEAVRDHMRKSFKEVIESASPSKPSPRSRKQCLGKGEESDEDEAAQTTAAPGEETTEQRQAIAKLNVELKKAKSKLEGDTMKADGVHSVELWSKAMKMLVASRAILLDEKEKESKEDKLGKDDPQYRETFPSLPHAHPHPLRSNPVLESDLPGYSFDFDAMLSAPAITEAVYGPIATPQPKRKESIASSAGRKGSVALHEGRIPGCMLAAQIRMANPALFKLPEIVWAAIIARSTGADKVLSQRQQLSIVKYARDWSTLMQERELRGKPDYNQWWNVLEKMTCLVYERLEEGATTM